MAVSVNISQNGKHLFATSEHSFSHHEVRTERFRDMLRRLVKAFPKSEGYEFGITNYEKTGQGIENEFEDILTYLGLTHF